MKATGLPGSVRTATACRSAIATDKKQVYSLVRRAALGRSPLRLRGGGATKADIPVAKIGWRTVPARDSHISRTFVERTALPDVLTGLYACVLHPFPDISQHVPKSKSVGQLCSYGMSAVVAVGVEPRQEPEWFLRQLCGPSVSGPFPLRFGRQSHADPAKIISFVRPANAIRRKVCTLVEGGSGIHDTLVCRLRHLGTADPEAVGNDDFLPVPFETIAFSIFRQAASKVAAGRNPMMGQTIQWPPPRSPPGEA